MYNEWKYGKHKLIKVSKNGCLFARSGDNRSAYVGGKEDVKILLVWRCGVDGL